MTNLFRIRRTYISKNVSSRYIEVDEEFDLDSDHSPIVLTLSETITKHIQQSAWETTSNITEEVKGVTYPKEIQRYNL